MARAVKVALALLTVAALGAGASGDVRSFVRRGQGIAPADVPPSPPAVAGGDLADPSEPVEWTLLAGGDVLMDRSEPAGRDPFGKLRPPLASADLALVNVEMAISSRGSAQAGKEFTFRSAPSAAGTIAGAGVDVGSLGNNHAMDFGRDALADTARHLREAGVEPVGAGADADEAFAPARFGLGPLLTGTSADWRARFPASACRRDPAPTSTSPEGSPASCQDRSLTIAVLGATGIVPGGWEVGRRPGLATTRGPRLVEAVRRAAAEHDVVIVMVHWGTELAPCPNRDQLVTGAALLEAGAAVVLGSHPHVLQPVVRADGRVIAYSLGNFAWHPRQGPAGRTALLELRFTGRALAAVEAHPHVLDRNGDPVPAPASQVPSIARSLDPRSCRLAP